MCSAPLSNCVQKLHLNLGWCMYTIAISVIWAKLLCFLVGEELFYSTVFFTLQLHKHGEGSINWFSIFIVIDVKQGYYPTVHSKSADVMHETFPAKMGGCFTIKCGYRALILLSQLQTHKRYQ